MSLLEAELPDTLFICQGDSVALNPDYDPNYHYEWFPLNGLNNNLLPNPIALPDSTILYQVVITDVDEFCRIERSVLVKVAEPIDDLTITASQDTIFGRGTVQLSTIFDDNFLYDWEPIETLNFSDIFNPVTSPLNTTTYKLKVRNESGCEAVASRTIVVVNLACEDPYIFIPSAFSPNGDGVNDVFRVRGNTIEQFYLAVYNRWGQRVFESNASVQGWDGTFHGEKLPPDVYGYYAEIRCFDGGIFVKKGNCTLIR